MRIKIIKEQIRRDLIVTYECEHCGHTFEGWAYDDNNFHNNVIPNMVCEKCGKKAPNTYKPRKPKYPEGMTV